MRRVSSLLLVIQFASLVFSHQHPSRIEYRISSQYRIRRAVQRPSQQVQVVLCSNTGRNVTRQNVLDSVVRNITLFSVNVHKFAGDCDDLTFISWLSDKLSTAPHKFWVVLYENSIAGRNADMKLQTGATKWNKTLISYSLNSLPAVNQFTGSWLDSDVKTIGRFVKLFLNNQSWKRVFIASSNDALYLSMAESIELMLRRSQFTLKTDVFVINGSTSIWSNIQFPMFKVVIFVGLLHSEEWNQLLEQVELRTDQNIALVVFASRVSANDFVRYNIPRKLLLFVVTSAGFWNNTDSSDTVKDGLLHDVTEVFSLTESLMTAPRYSSNFSGLIKFINTYEMPRPDWELIQIKVNGNQTGHISLATREQGILHAVKQRIPVMIQWIPGLHRFHTVAELGLYDKLVTPFAVIWPNGTSNSQDGCRLDLQEQCLDSGDTDSVADKTSILSIILAFFGLLILSGMLGFVVRWHMLRRMALKGPHKILFTTADLILPHKDLPRPDLIRGSSTSIVTVASHTNRQISAHVRPRSALPDSTARYNGELIHVRQLTDQLTGSFEIKSRSIDIIQAMQLLRSENLNILVGCLCDPQRPALLYEYCSRGSLYDVLKRRDVSLDWQFKLSLLTDLVRMFYLSFYGNIRYPLKLMLVSQDRDGMRYLHNSAVQYHGRLTSLNCVIDSRWVLKVTDYGLNLFEQSQGLTWKKPVSKSLLWVAPELLRDEGLQRRGTQTGDVYSFSIIVQEVLTQEEPFAMVSMTTEELIAKLRKPPPLIRPSVSKGAAPPELINLMRQCWSEAPESRPPFEEIYDSFKKFNQGKKVNIVDSMFEMLEKYSNNLEDLIRERTEQLETERRKTEQLLNRMLPSSVAEKLKMGLPIEPEQFDEVTIYFSDIVGFTTISAYSTPIQIVNLLNDLYTCFDATISSYNVYKVETIGDAYMVVGGLPIRSSDHAEQVATMALDLLYEAGRFQIKHLPGTPLRLRIGIHTGSCCAGVVGLTMPRFCLFGDTVNTASRMESTGAAWRIHMSHTTNAKLEAAGGYHIEFRGLTELRGKGQHPTYWLLNKDGFDKELPVPPELGLDKSLIQVVTEAPKEPTP